MKPLQHDVSKIYLHKRDTHELLALGLPNVTQNWDRWIDAYITAKSIGSHVTRLGLAGILHRLHHRCADLRGRVGDVHPGLHDASLVSDVTSYCMHANAYSCSRAHQPALSLAHGRATAHTTHTRTASSALILPSAVPCPPDTMAPACPIRRPGGAVIPGVRGRARRNTRVSQGGGGRGKQMADKSGQL